MLEACPDGFEEIDLADGVELAAYVASGGEERFRRAFASVDVEAVEPGWEDAWKRFHRPVRVGRLWVGPPWASSDRGALAVVIDPGRAFGTGAHATTRLCLALLCATEPASLVDLGCGSGVLAIAAAKLGFRPVHAFDLDDAAVEATHANAEANGVELEVGCADVLVDPLPDADVAVANIALGPVERVAGRLHARTLVASGYLASTEPSLRGWTRVERREAASWAADLFERT